MFGLIRMVLTLPFRVLYLLIKIITEIVEHSSHHKSHRRSYSRPRSRTISKQAQSISKKIKSQSDGENILKKINLKLDSLSKDFRPNSLSKTLLQGVVIAQDTRQLPLVRVEAYHTVFRIIDLTLDNKKADSKLLQQVDQLDKMLTSEYRKLVNQVSERKGTITLGPSLSIRTPRDAKRNQIKGAQWSALDDSCPLCKFLDGKTISVDHPEFLHLRPPLHDGCRCVLIYIGESEVGTEWTWETPNPALIHEHGFQAHN